MNGQDRPKLRLPLLVQQPPVFPTGSSVPGEGGLDQVQDAFLRAEASAEIVEEEANTLNVEALYR